MGWTSQEKISVANTSFGGGLLCLEAKGKALKQRFGAVVRLPLLSPRAVTPLTYGHKDIIYLVVGFCRRLHEQDAFGPCKLFPLLVEDKQSYSSSPL